jgi:hypothetical protein
MPYQFDFDSTNRILRGRLDGCVTDEVLKEYYRAAAGYAAQIDPLRGITDFSAVTTFDVSAETIRKLASSTPVMPDESRVRVVLAPTDNVFGLARLFQIEGENTRPHNHVVRTLREAWAVLGVHDPKFEALPTK